MNCSGQIFTKPIPVILVFNDRQLRLIYQVSGIGVVHIVQGNWRSIIFLHPHKKKIYKAKKWLVIAHLKQHTKMACKMQLYCLAQKSLAFFC